MSMVDTASFRRPVRSIAPDTQTVAEDLLKEALSQAPEGEMPPAKEATPPQTEAAQESTESGGFTGERPAPVPVEPLPPPTGPSVQPTPAVVGNGSDSEKMQKKIETILSEGLEEEFRTMTPTLQQQFRAQGEKTATAIRQMIEQSKVTARKVLDLIVQWLSMIPGVNRFFLEQEAKIKTDKMLEMTKPSE